MSFIKISFIKLPKYRVFTYTPRYYDADKDALMERKKRIAFDLGVQLEEEKKNPDAPYRPNIKGQMMHQLNFGKRKSPMPKARRGFMLIMLLLFVFACYFGSNLFGMMFNGMSKSKAAPAEQVQESRKNKDTHFIIPLPEK